MLKKEAQTGVRAYGPLVKGNSGKTSTTTSWIIEVDDIDKLDPIIESWKLHTGKALTEVRMKLIYRTRGNLDLSPPPRNIRAAPKIVNITRNYNLDITLKDGRPS